MPIMREFTIQMENQPGTLGRFCRVLADRGVNILAFHSFSSEGKSVVRIIVDKLTTAKTALDTERYTYTETEVAQAKLPHQPGELARAASRLGARVRGDRLPWPRPGGQDRAHPGAARVRARPRAQRGRVRGHGPGRGHQG